MNDVKPINPNSIEEAQKEHFLNEARKIPGFVIEAFNELIIENYSTHSKASSVNQNSAMERILKKASTVMPSLTREEVFKNKWMDVEPLFRDEGWDVTYNKPHYSENWDAYFTFKRKEKE